MAIYCSTTISDLKSKKIQVIQKHCCHSKSNLTSSSLFLLPIVLWSIFSVVIPDLCKVMDCCIFVPWGENCMMRPRVLNLHPSMLLSPAAREKSGTQHITRTCCRSLATPHQALWLFTKRVHRRALIRTRTSQRRSEERNICGKRSAELMSGGVREKERKKERKKEWRVTNREKLPPIHSVWICSS